MKLRALPVVGTRGKNWQIVNQDGGLVKYFEGTKRQAEAQAALLGTQPEFYKNTLAENETRLNEIKENARRKS